MPRRKNLLVADALRDDDAPEIDVTEDEAADAAEMVPAAPIVASPPAAPTAPIAMSLADLQALLKANSESQASGNAALADALTSGIIKAQQTIHENKLAPGVSTFNVLGDRDHPRPGLKCDIFLGTQDAKSKQVHRTYEFVAADLTAQEQIALNTLVPAQVVVERLDGAPMKVQVIPELHPVDESLTRLTIVVPGDVMAKGSQVKNMLPGPLNLVNQITGRDFSKLSHDDLKWFMAEHRAKRFVAERVAA